MTRQYVNPVGPDGKRKRGRPSTKVKASAEMNAVVQAQMARDSNETEAQRVKRIAERFTVMYKLTKGVVNGQVGPLIVSGAAGTGKSHTIDGLLSAAHERGDIRYHLIKGARVTGIHLYKLLYERRDSKDVILMDDSDDIYDDEVTMNLLKAALDTSEVRKLSWYSEAPLLKAENIPESFEYSGKMVFITNKDFQTIVDVGTSRMVPHMSALMSRSIYLDLKLHTPKDLLAWTTHLTERQHILVQMGLSHAEEKMILDWTRKHYAEFRELSLRTLRKIAQFFLASPNDWESIARVTILR